MDLRRGARGGLLVHRLAVQGHSFGLHGLPARPQFRRAMFPVGRQRASAGDLRLGDFTGAEVHSQAFTEAGDPLGDFMAVATAKS